MEKYGRAVRITDDSIILSMCFGCWITKATNAHSEYVKTYCFFTATMVIRTQFSVAFIRTLSVLLLLVTTGIWAVWVNSLWQNARKRPLSVFGSTHSNNTEGLQNLTSLHKRWVCFSVWVADIDTLAITTATIKKCLLTLWRLTT